MNAALATPWAPDRTLRGLLGWTALTTLFFWLPAVRGAFDGASYQWGLFGFGGRGTGGDYWFPLLGVAFAIAVQTLGWRSARPPFHVLLIGWQLLLVGAVVFLGLSDPEGFRLRGDTLGLDIPLTWVGLPFFGIPAALACLWSWRDLRRGPRSPAPRWQPRNTRWLAGLLLLLPLQLALLRLGPAHGTLDQIGVLVTIAQWLLLGRALRPYPAPQR